MPDNEIQRNMTKNIENSNIFENYIKWITLFLNICQNLYENKGTLEYIKTTKGVKMVRI